ncbi:MAG TPA: lysylphosphatidylglycerol synthase transmembrane domain-containing protein [Candidatus Limnocylindrales bacterium]|nr:lysylphosphatidylglycerol synthase transmembrane domain-containing protein [Candidatus Limnocylindrales bacterium]
MSDQPGPGSSEDEPVSAERADQLSLSGRLRQPRTIISILIPLAVIAVFVTINGEQLAKVPGLIARADLRLATVAFLIFYAGFPLRGVRWMVLLRGTGTRVSARDSTEIIFLSWLVNCVVPAKLGDVYRAYLLKINSSASLSRTFGTVFIERVLDLIAIALLGIAAGYWSFRDGLPPAIQLIFAIGLIVVGVLTVGLFTMRNFGRRILTALPLPPRVVEFYDRFEQGVFGAIALRQLPLLGGLTGSIWMTEALRLFLVIQAFSFADVRVGVSGAVFVALIGSLLTAVPLSPAGLGIVEAGIVGVLTVSYGVPLAEATAIALLDRVISVFSIIVIGSIAYLLSSKPRGLRAVVGPREPTSV